MLSLTNGHMMWLSWLRCVAAKEEEKQKLMKWSSELKMEREQLEQRVKQLNNSITVTNLTSSHPVNNAATYIMLAYRH
jgi:hypothetical protein